MAEPGSGQRIFVTGGTGMIGRALIAHLRPRHSVTVLSRRPAEASKLFGPGVAVQEGDPAMAGPWLDALDQQDAVVHLAGESILGGAWTEKFKAKLRASRVESTRLIAQRIAGRKCVLVNASAIGYHGGHGHDPVDENSPPAADFLARLCVDWEAAAEAAVAGGCRVVFVRVGLVLDPAGGVLGKLLTPFRWGVGASVGSGRQWMSWIHRDDLTRIFAFALENESVRGPLNGTAPHPVTNRDFSRTLARVLRRPCLLAVPGFALRIMLGEAGELALKGIRVLPNRVRELGFTHRFADLEPALQDLLQAKRVG